MPRHHKNRTFRVAIQESHTSGSGKEYRLPIERFERQGNDEGSIRRALLFGRDLSRVKFLSITPV